MRGCGCILVLAVPCLSLSACSSSQASLEAQYQSDLQNVLESITQSDPFHREVEAPSANSELSSEQLNMYVLVRAKAMQLAVEKKRAQHADDERGFTTGPNPFEADDKKRSAEHTGAHAGISDEERRVLKELHYSEEVYTRIKDTVDVTKAFLDAVDKPKILDLVTKYDPAIKHNLALVKSASHYLDVVNRYPIQRFHTNFESSNT
jgi:hypothetical protein